MKKLKSFLALSLVLISFSAFADDFTLTINNDTSDSFNLSARPSRSLDGLKPGEQNKVYALGFMLDRTAPEFALLLNSSAGQNASVIYMYPTIYCNPQTTYYRCSFKNLTAHSATLTLTKK